MSCEGTDLPKAIVTGNPLRPEIRAMAEHPDRDGARAELGLPLDRTVIAVFSGSLGSRRINEAVRGVVGRWADRSDLAVRHVIGRRDYADYVASAPTPPPDGLVYQVLEYEDRVHRLLDAADIGVTRAGGTVFELMAAGHFPADGWVSEIAFDDILERGFGPLTRGEEIKVLIDVAGTARP